MLFAECEDKLNAPRIDSDELSRPDPAMVLPNPVAIRNALSRCVGEG